MRVAVIGGNEIAKEVRGLLAKADLIVESAASGHTLYTISVEIDPTESNVVIDGIPCPLEHEIARAIEKETSRRTERERVGGLIKSDSALRILVPDNHKLYPHIALGIFRGFMRVAQQRWDGDMTKDAPWFKKKLWLLLTGLLILPCAVQAQGASPLFGYTTINGFWDGLAVYRPIDTANNAIRITCQAGTCGGASPFTDNSAFTAGTTSIGNIGAVFNDGLSAVTSGNAAAPRITGQRGLHANLRNNAGTEIATASNPLRVDPTGTTSQPVLVADTTSGIGALGSLNAVLTVAMAGHAGCGLHVDAGTLAGTLSWQISLDNGATYIQTSAVDMSTGSKIGTLALTNPNANRNLGFVVVNGTTHCRTLLNPYTSGTANGVMYATSNIDAFALGIYAQPPGQPPPSLLAVIGASDGTLVRAPIALNAAPAGTEYALVTRNLPSGTQTVSGTVTTTPPSNASTNVAQFGGTNVSTGTGAGGAGIPRVTISNDSSLAANQSVNLAQVGGATVTTGNGTAAGAQRVSIASDSTGQIKITDGTTVAGVIVGTTALKADVASIAGTATVTAAAGVQKVGVVGNANAALDAANNAAAPANVLRVGGQLQSGATATVGTTGQLGDFVASLDHVLYSRLGGPVPWSCSQDNIGATLTQCKAAPAAGLRDYITDIVIASTTTTAGQFLIRTGTGTNCATGTASLFPSSATVVRFPYPGNTSTIGSTTIHLLTPLQPPAAAAICIICVVTQTCTVQMQGFEAP